MKRVFKFSVKVKGSDAAYGDMDLMPPGVVAEQEVTFEVDEADMAGGMFVKALMEHADRFRDETIEVVFEDQGWEVVTT